MKTNMYFFIALCSFLLGKINVSNKIRRENVKTHISCLVTSPSPPPPSPFENRAVYVTGWVNIVEPGRQQIMWRVRNAC